MSSSVTKVQSKLKYRRRQQPDSDGRATRGVTCQQAPVAAAIAVAYRAGADARRSMAHNEPHARAGPPRAQRTGRALFAILLVGALLRGLYLREIASS
ncbi:MAG TPA: hypothetical protein VFZ65_04350, partial [Planctomycetota bacterium]|nr:hypothetical protein [Planctomycetota bacterium]